MKTAMDKVFSKARKGYNKEEVEAYVNQLEETLLKQRERIEELNKQYNESESQLKALRQKQDLIVTSIVSAVQKAEQIENLTKQKYAFDMAQLKAFHDRWTSYYNKLIAKYPLDNELRGLNEFNRNMSHILGEDMEPQLQMSEAEEQFKRESKRLEGLNKKKAAPRSIKALPKDDDDDGDYGIPIFNPEESIRGLLRRQLDEESVKRQGQNSRSKTSKQAQQKEKKQESYGDEDLAATQEDTAEAFSLEDCLNPKQELSEILKDLGLDI